VFWTDDDDEIFDGRSERRYRRETWLKPCLFGFGLCHNTWRNLFVFACYRWSFRM